MWKQFCVYICREYFEVFVVVVVVVVVCWNVAHTDRCTQFTVFYPLSRYLLTFIVNKNACASHVCRSICIINWFKHPMATILITSIPDEPHRVYHWGIHKSLQAKRSLISCPLCYYYYYWHTCILRWLRVLCVYCLVNQTSIFSLYYSLADIKH